MLLALFIIQGLVDLYLLRCVWALHKRSEYLRETQKLQLRASELMAEIMTELNNKINERESVQ